MQDFYHPIARDRVSQSSTVGDLPTIDKDHHMFAQRRLIIQNIGTSRRMSDEIRFQNIADGLALCVRRRTLDVALYVVSEPNVWHVLFKIWHRVFILVDRGYYRWNRSSMGIAQNWDSPSERYITAPLEALEHWNQPTTSPRESIRRCWGILVDNSPLD